MLYQGCSASDFAAKSQCYRFAVLSPARRRQRLKLGGLIAGAWVLGLASRLVSLQITQFEMWQQWGLKQHLAEVRLSSERGPLYDRYDRLLAVSVPAGSVYVRPGQVTDKAGASRAVAEVLGLSPEAIREKINYPKPFVWVKRQIPRSYAERVTNLKIPGVGYVLESKRYYPYNQAASALIGKVGVDGAGLSGVELLFDEHLRGEHRESVSTRDAFGNLINVADVDPEGMELPRGDALKLTLDAEIQMIVDEELEKARAQTHAKATLGVMVDARSGEILAMGQSPNLNFNSAQPISRDALRNLAVETVLEPGSIMKPLVAAAAIEAGLVTPQVLINCENGKFPMGRHTIKDVHPSGIIPLHDVVVRSSNIGMTKVGLLLGRDRLYASLTRYGFGENQQLGLAGETGGILRPVSSWAAVDVATHSFGQGIAVTPLQVARAVSAIANGGTLPPLHFLYQDQPASGERILSEQTTRAVREMMYGVVEDEHGTGRKALIPGVRVGGKTGTAQKARPNGRGYQSGVYAASFVGFVDASAIGVNRILTLVVVVDEPHGAGSIYGGTLAAPVFQRIMQRSLHVLSAEHEFKTRPWPGQEREQLPLPFEEASPAQIAMQQAFPMRVPGVG